jgi:MFS family permease
VTVAVFAFAVPLGYAPLYVLGPTVAGETYDSAAVFGVVTAAYGAGALLGGLIGLRWRPRHPMRAAFLVIAVWPLMVVAFATGVTLALVVPLAVATGMGFALFDVFWNTTMAEQIPPHALSRASAWEWMGSLILLPVGFLAAGPLADATSDETVLVGGAILTAAVLALGLVPRETRTMRRPEHRLHV